MTTTAQLRPEAPAGVLAAAAARRRAADAAEADLLQLAVEWAVMHPAESIHAAETHTLRGFGETDLALAGEGAPSVAEFCVAEFAAVVGLPSEAGKRYVGEALELCYRLPRLWRRVTSGDLPAWKARLVARETIRLTHEAAFVDRHVAPVAHRVRTSQLDRLVAEAIGRFMPDEIERLAAQAAERRHVTVHDQQVSFSGTTYVEAELDLADALDFEAAVAAGADQRAALGSDEPLDVRRAQAVGDLSRRQLALDLATTTDTPAAKPRRVVLHVHLSEAALHGADRIGRLEQGRSLVTVDQIRDWCGNPDAQVVVKPVVDLDGCVSVDSYEVPDRVSERVGLRDATCAFPWCTRPARRCDCDHTVAHRDDGDLLMQPRRHVPATSSAQDPLALELRRARPRSLPLDQSSRLPVPPRPSRHHRRLTRPATSGALARHLTALVHPGDRRGAQPMCWVTLMIAPFGSRTKNRRSPHSSSVTG